MSRLYVVTVLALALFWGGAMGYMGWRDHTATRHCHHIGGQTYDSGSHCVIGGKTVRTR